MDTKLITCSLLLISPFLFGKHALVRAQEDLTQYVNPFIGTSSQTNPGSVVGAGNIFPGAAMPFGVVKFGIDTTEFNWTNADANGGYTPDGYVTGLTMLHESGTGGGPTYGLIHQMPLSTLDGVNVMNNFTYMQNRTEVDKASVGYYKTVLANGVTAELSATNHSGIVQYTYSAGTERHILVDVSHYLPSSSEPNKGQFYANGYLERSENGTTYQGYGVHRGSFGDRPNTPIYFCADFDITPEEAQLWSSQYTDPFWPNNTMFRSPVFTNATSIRGGTPLYSYARRIGAVFTFPASTSVLKSRIGVSFRSAAAACEYKALEQPTWDLNTTIAAAKTAWNTEILSGVTTTDTSNLTRLEMLYSSLYKMHLMPSDRTGDNPNWETSEPSYDDFFTLWDTFRCLTSYVVLTAPDRAAAIVRSLIDIWRHERFMPDARAGNYNGRVQGGSNADNVLADAYVKGLSAPEYGINWTDGYAAMKTNAEQIPYDNWDVEDYSGSTKEGRGALQDWLDVGFITPNYGRSISRTVEYGLNDFSLSQVAKVLAPEDYNKYLNRSAGWQYMWQHDLSSLNFTGFLAPLYSDFSRVGGFDPLSCNGVCSWSGYTYEGLPWEYSWTIPYDMETLISFMGGPTTAEQRLDTMFLPNAGGGDVGSNNAAGSAIFNPGNEPSFATPFLYNYFSGRQWKSVNQTRAIVNQYYSNAVDGLPGNGDAGALESWLVWNLLGLYPVVTQPVYLLTSPWFSNLVISVGGNKTLTITASGLDEGIFVQNVTVNGVPWNKSWVSHDDLLAGDGGVIEFALGSNLTEWDTGDLPPSPGHQIVDVSN
ncbi:hypothetical protein B7494_g7330 [Chlorociboria aeruginascens]|nr:hypothetical protein B7494_g7330 [Chlorociboria aeruginascens]